MTDQYILSEMQIKSILALINRDCGMDFDEFVAIGKELRSHPYNPQAERDKVLNEKLASRYKAILMCCMDTIEDIRRKYEIAPKTCIKCSAYDLCEEIRRKEEQG